MDQSGIVSQQMFVRYIVMQLRLHFKQTEQMKDGELKFSRNNGVFFVLFFYNFCSTVSVNDYTLGGQFTTHPIFVSVLKGRFLKIFFIKRCCPCVMCE